MTEPIVGIDLGTTNSEIAILRNGQPHVFVEDGDPILPSFVGLADDGRLLVGKAARAVDDHVEGHGARPVDQRSSPSA